MTCFLYKNSHFYKRTGNVADILVLQYYFVGGMGIWLWEHLIFFLIAFGDV